MTSVPFKVVNINKSLSGTTGVFAGPSVASGVVSGGTEVTNVTLQTVDAEHLTGTINITIQGDSQQYKLGAVYNLDVSP